MRGRVNAVNSVFISCSNEMGAFESGVTARFFGTMGSVVLGGIATIVTVGAVVAGWPQILQVKRLKDQRPEEPPGFPAGPPQPPKATVSQT
jgi:hypothetical protein